MHRVWKNVRGWQSPFTRAPPANTLLCLHISHKAHKSHLCALATPAATQDELRTGVQRLSRSLSAALDAAHHSPAALSADSADSALLAAVASQGSMVLRSLSALQAFRKAQQVGGVPCARALLAVC